VTAGSFAVRARSTSLAFLLLLAPAIRGCSSEPSADPPRIDMSSDEAAARSIERVREKLDDDQRRELTDATVLLVRHALGVDRAAGLDPAKARSAVKRVLDGRTAAEVIAQARAVEAQGGVPHPAATATPPAGADAAEAESGAAGGR
jgi:hypothetical protein